MRYRTAVLTLACLTCVAVRAQESPIPEEWPYEIAAGDTHFTIYQPQLDTWDGHQLEAHMAVSFEPGDAQQATYGVAWVAARTDVDKEERLVTFDQLEVVKAEFPTVRDREDSLREALDRELGGQMRVIALDRLEAALAANLAAKRSASLPLKNDPPAIILATRPSLLVLVDGEPAMRAVADTDFKRVINTRPLLLEDASGVFYLHVFDGWLTATALKGTWVVAKTTPANLESAAEAATEMGLVDRLEGGDATDRTTRPSLAKGPVPTIYVASGQTELIVTDGAPKFVPIPGTNLVYASNTTGHLFEHTGNRRTYVLVSGRWFREASEGGPWEFVPGERLPDDFAKIPDDSPKENVKASVPGTAQAEEAVISNSIPQSAKVKRSEARLTPPKVDGAPQLAPIDGTSLAYVKNTATPIIHSGTAYYAVENGVWFTARSMSGPWSVATVIPPEIYSIPPGSPLYYVTFVRVYHSTPDVVYVSYTPGYFGTYVTDGMVVYGSGYTYSPWIGTVWYGPPMTYGFGVAVTFNPWSGWTTGFGFGWSWGAVTVGWGWGAYPWWGPYPYYPGHYYPPYWGGAAVGPRGAGAWGPGGWAGTTGNVYHRWGDATAVTRRSVDADAWTGTRWSREAGISYNSRTGNLAAGQRGGIANVYPGNRRGAGYVPGGRGTIGRRAADDLYAAHDGQVYRRSADGWERIDGDGTRSVVAGSDWTMELNREARARDAGQARVTNYAAANRTRLVGTGDVDRR